MIAQMQANHAQATVDFLANKFTSADLYNWMSGILGRVYGCMPGRQPQSLAWPKTSWPSSGRRSHPQ